MAYWKNDVIPAAPYYAVIFCSTRSQNLEGYPEMDTATIEKVKTLVGFLGFENIKNGDEGIFISYWRDMDAINNWKHNEMHLEAKQKGRSIWYNRILSQICKVEQSVEYKK